MASFMSRVWDSTRHPRGHGGQFGSGPRVTASFGPHLTDREARTHGHAIDAIHRWQHHRGDTMGAPTHERVRHAVAEHADALGLYSSHHHDQLLGHLSTDAGLSTDEAAQLAAQINGRPG